MVKSHTRIDDGVKRGPRKPIDRRPKQGLATKARGPYLPRLTAEARATVLAECYERLSYGDTTDQIAADHGLPGRTLRQWLLGDADADAARLWLINGELARTLDELRDAKYADSPLALACAREEFRAWSWIAERREARIYGQKQEVTTTNYVGVDVASLASAARLIAQVRRRQLVGHGDNFNDPVDNSSKQE